MSKPTKKRAAPAATIPPASERVRREWLRRVEAEYRSAAITQHLGLWLIQLGASPDLLTLGLRIVQDELDHASLSYDTFATAGGQGGPVLEQGSLSLADARGPLELRVAHACLEHFCLGETIAVRLFKALREKCSVPVARAVLDRVLVDEVRHRDFGWLLFGWLLEQPYGDGVRAFATKEIPALLQGKKRAYASEGAAATDHLLTEDDFAWGLMPAARYAKVYDETLANDYRRRFAKVGFEV